MALYTSDGIKIKLTSEWKELALENAWQNIGDEFENLKYRTLDNQVYIVGTIKNIENITNSNMIIALLPDEIVPQKSTYLTVCTNTGTANVLITGNKIEFPADLQANCWISFQAFYFID